jgi:hypothetical protein
MQRRSWLKLGAASTVLLAIGGGSVALLQPAWSDAKLAPAAREVFHAAARGLLDGTLPPQGPERAHALDALNERIEALIAGLPPHAQGELSQLLALLASAPGRRLFAGLAAPWPDASEAQIQQALQDMRVSPLALKQQAYQALHDIVSGAYFSEPATWAAMGYPGPRAI